MEWTLREQAKRECLLTVNSILCSRSSYDVSTLDYQRSLSKLGKTDLVGERRNLKKDVRQLDSLIASLMDRKQKANLRLISVQNALNDIPRQKHLQKLVDDTDKWLASLAIPSNNDLKDSKHTNLQDSEQLQSDEKQQNSSPSNTSIERLGVSRVGKVSPTARFQDQYVDLIIGEGLANHLDELNVSKIIISYIDLSDQPLSMPFIEENKDILDWFTISAKQKLSYEFIEKYQNYIVWFCLMERNPYIRSIKNYSTLWKICHRNGGCCYVSKQDSQKPNYQKILAINRRR